MRILGSCTVVILLAALASSCCSNEGEYYLFIDRALSDFQQAPERFQQYVSVGAAKDLAGYRNRMNGASHILGWNDERGHLVFTVQFEEGDTFWFVTKKIDGQFKITAVQAIDLERGGPTL